MRNGVSDHAATGHEPATPRPLVSKLPPLRTLVAYLAGILVLVAMTFVEHGPAEPAEAAPGGNPGFWSTDFWYERVVGTPDPRDRHVAVITVGNDMRKDFPLRTNAPNKSKTRNTEVRKDAGKPAKAEAAPLPEACRRRLYIAELLKSLAPIYPKVVVLDIWLDPDLCADQQVNELLSNELADFSRQAPIIFGVPSQNSTDLQTNSPAEFAYMSNRTPPLASGELVLMPVSRLWRPTGGRITEAVVRRDSDARRIPLSWPVYDGIPDRNSNAQPSRRDTLSVAAVRAFDAHDPVLKKIDALNPDGSPKPSTEPYPYTNFLRVNELTIERAVDVICSSPADPAWSAACSGTRLLAPKADVLNGKIVIIGIVGAGEDIHATVLGRVPGVILQANYTESLLNDRVYKPLSLTVDLLVGAIWLGAVFTIAWVFRVHLALALVLSLLATIIPAYIILKVLIWLGYYTELVIPIAVAAIVTNITVQFHHFLLHQGGSS